MSYLDTLADMKNAVTSSDLRASHKILLIELVDRESYGYQADQDAFVYFYQNILQGIDIFDFSSVLADNYEYAKSHARTCVLLFEDFYSLGEDQNLQSWLQSAIRFTDCIVIHYLQDVLGENPEPQGDAGLERSRYIQINRNDVSAERAGRIMDHLYDLRNKSEHITKADPLNSGKQILHPPNFRKIRKKIQQRYPQALESFNDAFKAHYQT